MVEKPNSFKDLYNMGEEYVFAGLGPGSIEFLRAEGLWSPIDHTLLENLPGLSDKKDLIYVSRTDRDLLIFILVEQGEFLQGVVHDLIREEGQLPLTLHEYQLVDGTTAKEEGQIIIDDSLFLYLYGKDDVILSEWTEKEIEEYLKQQ